MEFVSLKSLSMMLPSSPNSLQSFDSAKVINIHELAELIGPLSCIITGDWSEALRLRWTRAGEVARPREKRVHTSRPGLLCNRARRAERTMGCSARSGTSAARGSSASRLPGAPYFPETHQRFGAAALPPLLSPPSARPQHRDRGTASPSRRHPVQRSAWAALEPCRGLGARSRALGWGRGHRRRPTERCPLESRAPSAALSLAAPPWPGSALPHPGVGFGALRTNSLTRPPRRRRRSLGPARIAPGPAGHSSSRLHRSDQSRARGEPGTRASPPRKGGRTAPSPQHTPPLSLPTFLRLLLPSTPSAPKALDSLAPRARRRVEPRSRRAQFGLSLRYQVVIFRPPGVWQEYPGFRSPADHRNPPQNQASGRHADLVTDTSLIVAPDPPHLQWSKRAPLGLGAGLAKAATAPSIFWGARYRKAHKSPPPQPPHSHPHEAWRAPRCLRGAVGSPSRQPHGESQITLLGN